MQNKYSEINMSRLQKAFNDLFEAKDLLENACTQQQRVEANKKLQVAKENIKKARNLGL